MPLPTDKDRQQDDSALDHALHIGRDAEHVQPVVEHAQQHRAYQRANDHAATAGNRRAAQHNRRDCTADRVHQQLEPRGAHTGQAHGFFVTTDGINVAADAGVLQQYPGEKVRRQHDQNWHLNAKQRAAPEPGEPVGHPGNRIAVGVHQAKPAGDAHGGQRDDDRWHLQVRDEDPVADAKAHANQQPDENRNRWRYTRHHQPSGQRAGQRHHRPDGQIDTAGENHARHAHRDNRVDRHLPGDVFQVGPGEKLVAGKDHEDLMGLMEVFTVGAPGGVAHHFLRVDGRSLQHIDDSALVENGHAVAHTDDFRQFRRDHDDREALFGEFAHQGVDLRFRTDVDASGRLVEDQDVAVMVDPARDHHLLLITATEVDNPALAAWRLDRQLLHQLARGGVFLVPVEQMRRAFVLAQVVQRDVFTNAEIDDQAFALAALRQQPDAAGERLRRIVEVRRLAAQQHILADHRQCADHAQRQLRAPRPHQPGKPENLALVQIEAVMRTVTRELDVPHLQHNVALGAGLLGWEARLKTAPDHHLHQGVDVAVGNRQCAHAEFLKDNPDARRDGLVVRREMLLGAIDQNAALVLMLDAGKDLHQRRFARAVFAEQRVYLATLDLQVDRLERLHAGVAFTDVFQLQKAAHAHLVAALALRSPEESDVYRNGRRDLRAPLLGERQAQRKAHLVTRVLSGGGDELAVGLLDFFDGFWRAVDAGQLDVHAAGFDGRKRPQRTVVVDAEQTFEIGLSLKHNADIALAADVLRQVVASLHAGVEVFRADEGVQRTIGLGVNRNHHDTFVMSLLHGRLHAYRVGGVDDQNVDALLQHVFDVADLLGHIVTSVRDQQRCADAGRGVLKGVLHGHEIGVVDLLERSADFQRAGFGCVGGLNSDSAGAGNSDGERTESGANALFEANCHGENPVVFIVKAENVIVNIFEISRETGAPQYADSTVGKRGAATVGEFPYAGALTA
nr:hypothetical protein [Tanacetum cinerariifolium]